MQPAAREEFVCEDHQLILPQPKAKEKEEVNAKKLRKSRLLEERVIMKKRPTQVSLYFQSAPIWLLAIEKTIVSKVFISEFSSFSTLFSYLQDSSIQTNLYNAVINQLGRKLFVFGSSPVTALHLVSGSITFLNEIAQRLRLKKAIYITDTHTKLRQLPQGLLNFNSLSHVDVGGPTATESLYLVG